MIHWFAYDHFNPANPSEYWRSVPEGTPLPDYAKFIPTEEIPKAFPSSIECNSWRGGDFIAGMKISAERACIFRIFDGGNDCKGRRNRWVMLMAEGDREDFAGTDLLSAVDSETFNAFAASAKKTDGCTARAPRAMVELLRGEAVRALFRAH